MGGKGLGLSAEAMSVAGKTAAQEAAQIAKAKKFTDGVSGFTGSAIGRLGESIFERQGTQKEMLQKGYSQEEADNAADLNFMANMAMSSIDYAQNVKMLGVFSFINSCAPPIALKIRLLVNQDVALSSTSSVAL